MRGRRRTSRWAAAAALACGLVAASAGAAPSAAQEPPPTTVPEAPPVTVEPPTTVEPPGTETTVPLPPGTAPSTTETGPDAETPGTTSPPGDAPPTTGPVTAADDGPSAAADGPALVLDVPPGAQVVDGQALGLTVPGVASVEYASVMQCVPGPEPQYARCRSEFGGYAIVGGSLVTSIRLDAILTVGGDGLGPPREVDCRTETCEVVVSYAVGGGEAFAAAPLPFAPDGPLAPPPTGQVTPAGPYLHGQQVTVDVEGLVWSREVMVLVCARGATDGTTCDQATTMWQDIGDGTSAALRVRLLAILETTAGSIDCRAPDACEIVVTQGVGPLDRTSLRLPVAFDPDTEVVPPTLTVSPADGLVHGQVVTATGSGFVDEYVQFVQCAAVEGQPESCTWLRGWAFPGESGDFSAPVAVRAVVTTPTGDIDCRDASAPCVLVATGNDPSSSRAGRVTLHFDPDGPLPAPPAITVTPSTDLPEEATVTVAGTGFGEFDESAEVSVCRTGTTVCDESTRRWVDPEPDRTLTTQVVVGASFTAWDGTVVDCRAAPGCSVVVRDGYDGRLATAPLSFGAPPTMEDRYRLPVFDDVEITPDVVFRSATDAAGRAVDLRLSVYEPAGDTVEQRPVVVWLDGGWFSPGAAPSMRTYAEAFARRGYVSVTMQYRTRPGLACCPTNDIEGVTAAAADATDDAAAGVRWLREHADELGIDADAITVAGAQGGATAAFGLAHVAGAPIAAAVPVDGVGFGRPDRGEPPFLAIHAERSTVAPAHLSEWACTRARALGTTCATTVLGTDYGDLLQGQQRSIVVEASAFVADVVLAPRGYTEHSGRDWGATGGPGGPGGGLIDPLGTLVPGGALVGAVALTATGRLPVTGANLGALVALALVLVLVGAAVLVARRRGRRGADLGSVRLWVAAGAAVVLVVAGFAVTSALGSDGDTDETAGGGPTAQDDEDAATGEHDHDDMDHDAADHGDAATDHDALGHSTLDHDDTAHDPADHEDGDHASTGTGHAHRRGTGAGTTDHAHGTGTGSGDGHEHTDGTGGTGTGHEHTDPTTPGHEHTDPSTPPHTHPEPENPTGFDPAWSPEQVAFAQQLVADTQTQLVRYDTLAILPLTGYQWISDGREPDGYQHWINLGRIIDAHRLDAAYPESLVLRTTTDGPELEAAMYMLSTGYNLGNIPADIAWLPGWHVHDNLCFENGYELVGVTVNGVCERGYVVITPPMIHVWREPTECGYFAGVDEFGLQCDHEH